VSLFDLTGRNAFVTGASRGIGRSIAVALAASGADVALVARTEAGLADTAADITALGRKAVVIPTDVTRKDEVGSAVAAAIGQLEHIEIVVNNAGGSASWPRSSTCARGLGEADEAQPGLRGVRAARDRAAPDRARRRLGDQRGLGGRAGAGRRLSPYGAAKAGLISLTKTLAVEWGTTGCGSTRCAPAGPRPT
jgi:NAD(P)-dependent dehydrogenase (short-subunit alcohol dehydrogenase family)